MRFICGGCGREWESESREERCENCGARVVAQGVNVTTLPGRGLRIVVLVGIVVVLAIAAVGLYTVARMPTKTYKQERLLIDALDSVRAAIDEYRIENEGVLPDSFKTLLSEGALPEGAKVSPEGKMLIGKYRVSYFTEDREFILYAKPIVERLRSFLATDKVYVVDSVKVDPSNYYEAQKLLREGEVLEE